MRKWLEYERGFMEDGIISKDQYADWCVPPEDPKLIHSQDPARVTSGTLIATAFYYHLLRKVAAYARILDRPTDAAELEAQAATVNQAFQKRFYKPASSVYDNATQTSSVLPLYFQMAPTDARGGLMASLARNIEEVTHGHVGTGLIGAQFLMRTLSDNGRADLAYQIATQQTYPGWGYMVSKGATTIWELWNGDTADPAMNSGNHVMQIGDLAVWMYEYLAGMRSDPAQPGFRHILDSALSGRRFEFRGSVAPIALRQDRGLLEARRRQFFGGCDHPAEHHGVGLASGQGCGIRHGIRRCRVPRARCEVRAGRGRRGALRGGIRKLPFPVGAINGPPGPA